MAASRIRGLSVDDLALRLDRRFEVLTGGSRAALERHQTLRALVDWSYGLLSDTERSLFQQLSVFSGGWTLDAAESVCPSEPGAPSTLDLLGQLVDKSLVRHDLQPDGTGRYGMLETLRVYAAERLRASGQTDEVQRRHAMFFADTVTRRWGLVWWVEDEIARVASIKADYDNFRTALRWLIARAEAAAAQRLAGPMGPFWMRADRLAEGRIWLKEVLELPQHSNAPTPEYFRTVYELAQLDALGGNRVAALEALEAVLPAASDYADAATFARALGLAGSLTWYTRHDLVEARAYAEEGLRVAQTTHVGALVAHARGRLATLAYEGGEYDVAERLLAENLANGHRHLGRTTLKLAQVRFIQANYAAAAALLEDMLSQYDTGRWSTQTSSPATPLLDATLAATVLSWTRLAQGDVARATTAGVRALRIARESLGRSVTPWNVAGPIEALAMVAAAVGQPARALRLAGAGAALREERGAVLTPNEHALLERWLGPARARLGHRASATAWAAGRSLGAEAAIDEALSAVRPPTRQERGSALTPREGEVMALVARGLTNRQIGTELVITEGTARVHVERILSKLNLHSRSQVVAWAVQHETYGAETCLPPDADRGASL